MNTKRKIQCETEYHQIKALLLILGGVFFELPNLNRSYFLGPGQDSYSIKRQVVIR